MEHVTPSTAASRELRTIKILMGLALASMLTAILAGLALLTASPGSGSTIEGMLGFTAAISGLATAGFSIAAAIYAQAKNLWQYAPARIRRVLWTVIGLAITMTVLNLINQALDQL